VDRKFCKRARNQYIAAHFRYGSAPFHRSKNWRYHRLVRAFLLFLLCAAVAFGETFRLYLKDGDYQIVREYQVQGDRVRYFTTERGDWEEVPTSMVDLQKTEKERKAKTEVVKEEAKQDAEEQQALREQQREIDSVPQDEGAYFNVDGKIKQLDAAPYQVVTDKKRAALKLLSPVPIIPGKASVVIDAEHSKFIVHDDRPIFYFRPQREESFGIIRVAPKKGHRIVENISIIPVANQGIQNRDQLPVFQQQLAGNLYKVWPEKSLEPGEYAVVEYHDSDEESKDLELLVWDFAYQPGAPAAK
jgi:hypothetical protein